MIPSEINSSPAEIHVSTLSLCKRIVRTKIESHLIWNSLCLNMIVKIG